MWRTVAGGLANTVWGITTPRCHLKHGQSLVLLAVQSRELSVSLTPRGSVFLWLIRSSTSRRCLCNQSAPSEPDTTTKETSWSCGWWHWPVLPEMHCCNAHAICVLWPFISDLSSGWQGPSGCVWCLVQHGSPISCGFWTLARTVANDKRSFVLSV